MSSNSCPERIVYVALAEPSHPSALDFDNNSWRRVFTKRSTVMRSGSGLFRLLAALSTVGVVLCARDFGGVKSRWRSNHVHVVSGLRRMHQSDGLDGALLGAVTVGDATRVQQLLDAGANPNTLHEDEILTPLIEASARRHADIVRILLNAGADVNFQNRLGNAALHLAARIGQSSIVGLLLENGADSNSKNIQGWTPLHFASRYGHDEALEKLMHAAGANISFANTDGMTALHLAAWNGHSNIVGILLENGADLSSEDNWGWTSLHHAARFDHLDVVKLLLEKGANIEAETFNNRHTPMSLAAVGGSASIIQALIDAGANKNHKSIGAYTPLIQAAFRGHQEAIEVLVENGADKSAVAEDGLNARDYVCRCTTASQSEPGCDFEACEEPERMERLLDP